MASKITAPITEGWRKFKNRLPRRKEDPRKNAEWVSHMNEVFSHIDVDRDGYISLKDCELWVHNIQKDVGLDPDHKLVAKLRKSLKEFCGAIGLTPPDGRVTRDVYLDMMAKFAAAEWEERRREHELLFQLMDAWYDIAAVGTNNDDPSMVTLDGYKKVLKACNFDERDAVKTFSLIDKDHGEKIERSKLIKLVDFHFWFPPVHEASKGAVVRATVSRWSHYMKLNKFRRNVDWVHRMKEVFTIVDDDNDGYISLKDWEVWVYNIQKEVGLDPHHELVNELHKSLKEFCGAIGFTPDSEPVNRQEFVYDMMAEFAVAEGDKMAQEEWLLYHLNHAWFNIVDPTKDDMVTLEGYKKIMKACKFGEDIAEVTFELFEDKANPGKVERLKLIDMEFKFWFTLGHEESKHMFGDTFAEAT